MGRVIAVSALMLVPVALRAHLRDKPFPSIASATASTRFTPILPQQSGVGVSNLYDDPAMWAEHYRAFMGGAMGSGVAVGDFDSDGLPDLYIATKTKPGRLYRNRGNWTFDDVTKTAGLETEGSSGGWFSSTQTQVIWNQGAVFADVNNDGHLDLYVCRYRSPNRLYINQGDGTFKEEANARGLDLSDGSVVGAFADYDRDGWLDVMVLTNQIDGTEPQGRPDRLYRNQGNGVFREVTQQAGIDCVTFGHSASWFDADGDLWPDLYIANDFSGPDYFYRNNRDGTFRNITQETVPHTPYSSMGADSADVDNDGAIDLLVADMAPTTREKDRRGLAASRNDMITAAAKAGAAPQYMRNVLLHNTGLGVFREAAILAGLEATDWTWSTRFEDFDNDGWVDLHVTNGMVREANNSDVLASMMKALSDAERIAVMKRSAVLNEANLVFRNQGGLEFQSVTEAWGLGEVGVSFGAATGDFDRDGDLDLVWINYDGGVSLYRNDTEGQHRVQVRLRGTQSNRFGVGARVSVRSGSTTQHREMVVARGYCSGSELVAHFGLGQNKTIDELVVHWPSGEVQRWRNLPADRSFEVTEGPNEGAPQASVAPALWDDVTENVGLNHVNRARFEIPDREQGLLPFRTDRGGPAVVVADWNGDGNDDLFFGQTKESPRELYIFDGGEYRRVALEGLPENGVEDGPLLAFDFDRDGTLDLLLTSASAEAKLWPAAYLPRFFSYEGDGKFAERVDVPLSPINVGASAASDFDHDGDIDLFLGSRSVPGLYPDAGESALWLNDGGRYTNVIERSPALKRVGLVKGALWRDATGDGRADLVIALEWDYVRVFENLGDGRFEDATFRLGFDSGGRGWWNGMAAADFNGDGREDFAVGNLGLNTVYRASKEQPVRLYAGDFARNGGRLLIESIVEKGQEYPLRSKGDLGARIPSVLRRFPKTDDFARAPLAAVLGEEPLKTAERREADQFASGVFLSQTDGGYRFSAFPRLAQGSPLVGLLVSDFNADGRPDLIGTQNLDIAVPRFDGGVGLVMWGQENGSFTVAAPSETGFLLPGNGRALARIAKAPFESLQVVTTRHGGATTLWQTPPMKGQWLTVHVNPVIPGSQVRVFFEGEATQSYSINLGEGGWGQSTSAISLRVPEGAKATHVDVCWTDGTTTTKPVGPNETVIQIRRLP